MAAALTQAKSWLGIEEPAPAEGGLDLEAACEACGLKLDKKTRFMCVAALRGGVVREGAAQRGHCRKRGLAAVWRNRAETRRSAAEPGLYR